MNQIETSKSNHNAISITLTLLLIGVIFLYLQMFFAVGVRYNNRFLEKKTKDNVTIYQGSGSSKYHWIKVTRDSEYNATITYYIPGYIERTYHVEKKYSLGKDRSVVIISNSNHSPIFEGVYDVRTSNVDSYIGDLVHQLNYDIHVQMKNIEQSEISTIQIIELFFEENLNVKGNASMLLMGFFLLMLTLLDIRYPKLLIPLQSRMYFYDDIVTEEDGTFKLISQCVCITLTILLFILSVSF